MDVSILNYDLLETIIKLLDVKSIQNFLISCKTIYSIYKQYPDYIQMIIATKIGRIDLHNTKLDKIINIQEILETDIKTRKIIFEQLNKLNQAKTKKYSEFLIILSKITSSIDYFGTGETFLFDKILKHCCFKFWVTSDFYRNDNCLSTNDIEKIFIYGNNCFVNLILLNYKNYNIPIGVVLNIQQNLKLNPHLLKNYHLYQQLHK